MTDVVLLFQVLLKWNMQRGVPVIPKATSRDHLAENFVGMSDWRLTNEQKVRHMAASSSGLPFARLLSPIHFAGYTLWLGGGLSVYLPDRWPACEHWLQRAWELQ